MSGFRCFLRKEARETLRTWRIWVLPGMILFFAITSPIIALLTPALVASLVVSQPGVVIKLPDPVARDAYMQFIKNLDQLVMLAIIIAGAGTVSGEIRAGTATMVLTKPLSRGGFVAAKVVAQGILLVLATALGAAVCLGTTRLLFGVSPVHGLLVAVSLWLVFALFMVAVMTLLSVVLDSQGGAAGVGLVVYFATLVLRSWGPAADHSFAGLPKAAYEVLEGGDPAVSWPVMTAVILGAAATWLAARIFRRAEI